MRLGTNIDILVLTIVACCRTRPTLLSAILPSFYNFDKDSHRFATGILLHAHAAWALCCLCLQHRLCPGGCRKELMTFSNRLVSISLLTRVLHQLTLTCLPYRLFIEQINRFLHTKICTDTDFSSLDMTNYYVLRSNFPTSPCFKSAPTTHSSTCYTVQEYMYTMENI